MAEVSKWLLENDYTDYYANNNLAAQGSGNTFSSVISKQGQYSLQLNGSGAAFKAGMAGINTGNADRSMGGWFYPNTGSAVAGIMAVGSDLASQGFTIIKLDATHIRVDLQSDALSFTVPTVANNTWYWVWVQYTASTKTSDLYLNNVQSSSGAQAHAGNSNLGTNNILLGLDIGVSNNLIGNLDDCRYWNGVTTAAERSHIFSLFKPRVILF